MITIVVRQTGGVLRRRQWRWNAVAGNGKIVATSGSETYANYQDVMDTLHQLFSTDTPVTMVTPRNPEPLRLRG